MNSKTARTMIVGLIIAIIVTLASVFGNLIEASAQTSAVPETIRSAMLRGGTALVFGCYDSSSPNLHEFDAELPIIASQGIGAVRLTCSMDTLEQGTTGLVQNARMTEVIDFVNLAWSYGLVTIVDVHNTGMREPGQSDWTDNYMWGIGNPAIEARHTSLVTDLARRLSASVPTDRWVLQPANEPIDQPTWYSYQQTMFNSVRAACPSCTVVVMGRDWQGIEETIARLNVGAFSQPFIVDFHLYEPIGLTHCQYPGTPDNCPGKQYPGVNPTWRDDTGWFQEHGIQVGYWDRNTLEQLIEPAAQFVRANGVFGIFGEIGTTASLGETTRARYLGDVVSVLRQYGLGFTEYEWYRNFGVKEYPAVIDAMFMTELRPTSTATMQPSATWTIAAQPTATVTGEPTGDPYALMEQIIQLRQSEIELRAQAVTIQDQLSLVVQQKMTLINQLIALLTQ